MAIEFGFDARGGFCVVDHADRVAEYAYPTSESAAAAKVDQVGTARAMLLATWRGAPVHIREAHYLAVCESLRSGLRLAFVEQTRPGWFLAQLNSGLRLTNCDLSELRRVVLNRVDAVDRERVTLLFSRVADRVSVPV